MGQSKAWSEKVEVREDAFCGPHGLGPLLWTKYEEVDLTNT